MVEILQCRLCAEFKTDIIHVQIVQEMELEYKIQQCFGLDFNNSFSKTICLDCSCKVSEFYAFKELVKSAQDRLIPIPVIVAPVIETIDNSSYCVKNELILNTFNEYYEDLVAEDEKLAQEEKEKLTEVEVKKKKKGRKPRTKTNSIKKQKPVEKEVDPERRKITEQRLASLQKSKEMWNNYKWICVDCNQQCLSLPNLQYHYSDVHSKSPQFLCTECSEIFDVVLNFKKHVIGHYNKNRHCCEICGRGFRKKDHLKNHIESHSTDRKYVCSECGKTFKRSTSYRRHVRAHSFKLQYKCEYCNRMLSKPGWIAHQKKHQGIKDYICHHCGKYFHYQCNLKEHIKYLHSDAKPYLCKHCNKRFKTQTNLNAHVIMHTNQLLHACEVCGKRFLRKRQLDVHQTVHSNEKPFPCEFCHKRFSRKQLLQIHLRQHTGERPYSCLDCNHHFSNSSNYIKHMRQKHGVQSIKKNSPYKSVSEPVESANISENNSAVNTDSL